MRSDYGRQPDRPLVFVDAAIDRVRGVFFTEHRLRPLKLTQANKEVVRDCGTFMFFVKKQGKINNADL
ncbi:MAG: hypothetical protein JXR89_11135 [Deltaproteobacteria bacterium]|nr:hypothetical protein [Deltaproteobacteria bacterium]